MVARTSQLGADSEEKTEPLVPGGKNRGRGVLRGRRIPLLSLLAYYLVLVGVLGALSAWLPVVREALISPIVLPAVSETEALLGGAPTHGIVDPSMEHTAERSLTTLLVVLGALALMLPVAWVYMHTKRLRYDPSLVQSVIILPIVVAGILIIVKNSLALAFSLAGIVAAVRFRNTLKDPKDAVYIFLAIGTGIAAGVQALDIALVVSVVFNLVVLVLWRYNVGALYSRGYGARGILSIGDRRLLSAGTGEERRFWRKRLRDAAGDLEADGILLVHVAEPQSTRHAVEAALSQTAKEWRLVETVPGSSGFAVLAFVFRLKKKATVVDLLGHLDDRWSAQVVAAEVVPVRNDVQPQESGQ